MNFVCLKQLLNDMNFEAAFVNAKDLLLLKITRVT